METTHCSSRSEPEGSLLHGHDPKLPLRGRYNTCLGGLKGKFRNVWAFKVVVRRLISGDPDIKIFFEVVNDEGLRNLRPLQTHEDTVELVENGMDVPFTKVFFIPMAEMAIQLDVVRQPDSEVPVGYFTDYSVHNKYKFG